MTPTIVKAADAAQFLSFVPRMLGYHPSQSLVVIPFHGSRSLGAMRFDLPVDRSGSVDSVAATVIGMACRLPEADAVAAIAYTDASFAGEGGMPHRALLEALDQRADACGLRVTDLLCVAADAWGSALDAGCPPMGRILDAIEHAGAGLDPELEPVGDQSSGTALPEATAAEREAVAAALDTLDAAVAVLCGPETGGGTAGRAASASSAACAECPDDSPAPGGPSHRAVRDAGRDRRVAGVGTAPPAHAGDLAPVPAPVSGDAEEAASLDPSQRLDPRALAAVCRLDDLPGYFEEALNRRLGAADPYESAALVWCLARPSLRDVALLQWSGDLAQGDEAFEAQLRWESGEEYPPHLAERMWGEGDPPRADRIERALEVARHAAAVAPREVRPGALALCAWLSWALGRSTHAAAYAEHACDIEPEHGLSHIVLSFVRAGHLPDWAFRPGRPVG